MPSTMGQHSRIRAPQDSTKVLAAVGPTVYQALVILGHSTADPHSRPDLVHSGYGAVVGEVPLDPVQAPWTKRLLAQLNTGWVPRCILLYHHAVPGTVGGFGTDWTGFSQAQYDAAWLQLVNAAQTSSARVIVLVGSANQAMLYALPADEWFALLPPNDLEDLQAGSALQFEQACLLSNLIYNS